MAQIEYNCQNSDIKTIKEENIKYRNEKTQIKNEIYARIFFRNIIDISIVIDQAKFFFDNDLYLIEVAEDEMIVTIANREFYKDIYNFSDDDCKLEDFSRVIDEMNDEADTQNKLLEIMTISINSWNRGFARKEKIILEKIKSLSFSCLNSKQKENYKSVLIIIIDWLLEGLPKKEKNKINGLDKLHFPEFFVENPERMPLYQLFENCWKFEQEFGIIMDFNSNDLVKYKKISIIDVRKHYYKIIDEIEEYEKSDDKEYLRIYTGIKGLIIKKMRKAERHLIKLSNSIKGAWEWKEEYFMNLNIKNMEREQL